jgi:hypothetical protein
VEEVVCQKYTKRTEDGNGCESEQCQYETQVLTIDGTCYTCPEGSKHENNNYTCAISSLWSLEEQNEFITPFILDDGKIELELIYRGSTDGFSP